MSAAKKNLKGLVTIIDMDKHYPLAKMKPYAKNPRVNDHVVAFLEYSLERYGAVEAIVVDKKGRICAGHARYKAALNEGRKTFPTIICSFASEAAFVAYNIVSNQSAQLADWDPVGLHEALDYLEAEGWEPEDVAFGEDDLAETLAELEEGELTDGLTDPDDVPEPPKKAISKTGDLWLLGDHRILCGDATKREDVERLCINCPSLIVTSPPYNLGFKSFKNPSGIHKDSRFFKSLAAGYEDGENMDEVDYQQWQIQILDLWYVVSGDGAALFYNHKYRYRSREPIIPLDWIRSSKWVLRQEIIWDRGGGVAFNAQMFIPSDERWYWCEKSGSHTWNGVGHNRTNIWKGRTTEVSVHPADYPVSIVSIPIEFVSNADDIIADPFLGSGTTMIAAETLKRKCYGMEIEPIYVDVSVRRWQNFTGKKATLIRNGKQSKITMPDVREAAA